MILGARFAQLKGRVLDRLSPVYKGRKSLKGAATRARFESLDRLVEDHFRRYSEPDHPCRRTLTTALERLGGKPAVILETGSSAWGTNSSLLFDSYVNSFGGTFTSVDIRAEPMFRLRSLCTGRSEFFCDDSVSFLRRIAAQAVRPDLVYLDSWDVDWTDPLASAMHGLHEFLIVFPLLRDGALLLVDDTPLDSDVMRKVQSANTEHFDRFSRIYGFTPGKGALIKNFLLKSGAGRGVKHEYQLLWEF